MKSIKERSLLKELNSRYKRVSQNVNFERMLEAAIIFVGVGASGHMIEQIVRLGIKAVYLFDPDKVEKQNIPAQNFTLDDIGLYKTEALGRRLEVCQFEKDNSSIPPLEVYTYGDFLEISDHEIQQIIQTEGEKGRQLILVMASDYHPVQARGSRISLKFGIPTFWVGIYREGMAGEIIFYIPGHDLLCYRCITETRYQFFDKNRLANHLKGDYSGSGRSSGLPMAATFIDSILSHLIIGFIHSDIEENQHGKLFRRLLDEKRNFIQCQLDPDYKLNDTEDIFAQIQEDDLICFNTIFQHERRKFECIDCPGFAIGWVWKNTDYTKENYRQALERYSKYLSAFAHGHSLYHPLLSEYDSLFAKWEKYMDTEYKAKAALEATVERNGKIVNFMPLGDLPIRKTIRNVEPGLLTVRFSTGETIWQEELTEKDLVWANAFPDQALNLAADTGETEKRISRTITMPDGMGQIRIYPELENGAIEITISNI